MTNEEKIELLTGACRAYDRLSIVMDQMMEHWLEGNCNPSKDLIEAYYTARDDVGEHINVGRLHEQIATPNSEFFEKINSEFGLDNTPRLF
jgi:site-specific DNA-adenine methylase